MTLIHDILLQHLPAKRRITPKNWILFNGVCCHHRGHKPDTRMRGNLRISEDGVIGGNCYNCGFKFKFDGQHLSSGFEMFLSWLGVERNQIQTIKMELLKEQINGGSTVHDSPAVWNQRWESIELPEGSEPIEILLENDCNDENFVDAICYLQTRSSAIVSGYDYYWCNQKKNNLYNRLILPFYHQNQIVGYTARYCGNPPTGVPKYWNSNIPTGFLFNNDVAEITHRQFLILVEGPFDAIAIQGVGALGSTLSDAQIHWLVNQNKTIIVLPDRQRRNQSLIDTALLFGWHVSFPDWENHVKDAADACKNYGQVYTVSSVIASKTANPIEIGIKRKMLGE